MGGHHRVGDGVRAEPTDVLRSFFAELDRSGVEHALLHDPDDPFGGPGSDIYFVVAPHDLRRVERLALKVVGEHGWLITQRRRHELWADEARLS